MTARSTIRLGIAFGAAIVTSVVSDRAADAADGDLLVQLEYSVAPACPDEAAFVRDVRARAPRFDVGRGGERAIVEDHRQARCGQRGLLHGDASPCATPVAERDGARRERSHLP